jgi:RNA polymerase sigma-70 factor (ECF subfamily)
LAEQDMTRWDQALIAEAEALLLKAAALERPGRYQIEAAIQSAHVVRRSTGTADWKAIVDLYGVLASMVPSPVVAVNRAVALAQAGHAGHALAALDELADDPRLADYQPYWAARAEILVRAAGRPKPRPPTTGRSGSNRIPRSGISCCAGGAMPGQQC